MTEFVYLQKQWRILRWTREGETRIKENNGTTLKCIILDMTAVSAIDTSGLEAVFALRRRLEKQSLQLALVNPVGTDGKATQVQDQKPIQSIDLLNRNFLSSLLG
ncbi:STAS domain [Arabidopsis suecica]|uniref:STAS domain n=1 Tax=Arabidopsis suecica TaxID=45249 RepID=A0A8T2B872_ARASU|nr:STAS domain [Arabidopsis suecica]